MKLTPREASRAGRLGLATVAASLLLMVASCAADSGSSDLGPGSPEDLGPGSPGGPGPARTGGPIPAGLADPCSLLTTNELAAMAGGRVLDGVRDAEEDGSFVACRWYSPDDDLKIVAVVDLTLFIVNDEMKQNIQADIISGKGEKLAGVGENTEVQAADLGAKGNSYAAGWKASAFYRLQCNTPVGGGRPAKAICTEAVTAVAARLP